MSSFDDLVGQLVTHPKIRSKHQAAVLHIEDDGTAMVLDFTTKHTLRIPAKDLTRCVKNDADYEYGYVGLPVWVYSAGKVLKRCRGIENIRRNMNKIQAAQRGVVSFVNNRDPCEFLIVFEHGQKFAQRMNRHCFEMGGRTAEELKKYDEKRSKEERQRLRAYVNTLKEWCAQNKDENAGFQSVDW